MPFSLCRMAENRTCSNFEVVSWKRNGSTSRSTNCPISSRQNAGHMRHCDWSLNMGKINLNPEWVTHATMARFLRMRQDVLYQKVLSGEVPAKTLGDGQIRVESRTDVYYPYMYNKKLVLSCLGYKP